MLRRMRGACALVLLAGCGGPNFFDSSRDGGADSDADTDGDTDADEICGETQDEFGCNGLYDAACFPTFRIEISDTEWAALEDEFRDPTSRSAAGLDLKPYHPLESFRYGGEEIFDAQIRLKGNPFFSWIAPKMQFVISFNEVDPDRRFHGVRKVSLDAPWYEPSLLHERLSLAVLREAGLPAQCANSARLFKNGEYYGVYTNQEYLDREFLERTMGDAGADGDLWKYGRDLKTNEETATHDRIDAFWAATDLAAAEALGDVDQWSMMWAGEAVLNDLDGYFYSFHNFHLYDHPTDGFMFVPSDLDFTWDGSTLLWSMPATTPVTWVSGIGERPAHVQIVLGDPTHFDRYVDAVETVLGAFDPPTIEARVSEWGAQIEDAVDRDPNKTYTTADHDAAIASLPGFARDRADFVANWLECFRGTGNDGDEDGTPWCLDCDDTSGDVHPGAAEDCDGVDDDCNGVIDDNDLCPDCLPQDLEGASFSFCTRARSWADARAQCQSDGGDLAIPANDAEQAAISLASAAISLDGWWIGVNDVAAEGTYTDPSGAPLDYTPWAIGRPNGGPDQNCVVSDPSLDGFWNDKACEELHPAICRMP